MPAVVAKGGIPFQWLRRDTPRSMRRLTVLTTEPEPPLLAGESETMMSEVLPSMAERQSGTDHDIARLVYQIDSAL